MKKTKLGAFVVILATFILGVVAGYAISTIIVDTEAGKEPQSPYGNLSEYLEERLELSDDQIRLYDGIVKERREKMDTIHKQFRGKFREQTDSLHNEIRAILNAEQLQEYEVFLDEYIRYRKEQRRHRE